MSSETTQPQEVEEGQPMPAQAVQVEPKSEEVQDQQPPATDPAGNTETSASVADNGDEKMAVDVPKPAGSETGQSQQSLPSVEAPAAAPVSEPVPVAMVAPHAKKAVCF